MGATMRGLLKLMMADLDHLRLPRCLDSDGLNGVRWLNMMGRVGLLPKKLGHYEKPCEAYQQSSLARCVYCYSSPMTSNMPLTTRLWHRTDIFHLHFYSILVRKPRSQLSVFLHCSPMLHNPALFKKNIAGPLKLLGEGLEGQDPAFYGASHLMDWVWKW